MSKPLGIVSSVAITFLTTLALNTALNYFTADRGTIATSGPVLINGESVTVVTIENFTKEILSGLALELPIAIPLSAIKSDSPVQLVDAAGMNAGLSRLVTVNGVAPRRVTRIFISAPDAGPAPMPRLVNTDAAGLNVRNEGQLRSPLFNALMSALLVAAFYAMLSAAITIYFERKLEDLSGRVEKLKTAMESQEAETREAQDKLKGKLRDVEGRLAKQRLLLQARLFDYAKELTFWRSTIAKVLLDRGGTLTSAEDVTKAVTSALETHGANVEPKDFEAVKIAAAWLREAERPDEDKEPIHSA